MSRYFTWILLLIIALHMIHTNSQSTCKTNVQGKHFIVAFPENYQTNTISSLHVIIVSFHDGITQVNLSSPHRLSSNTYFAETVNVQPMSYELVIVPRELEIVGTERNYKTVEIIADFDISVHILHLESGTSDGYLAIPTDSLGTKYVVTSNVAHSAGYPGLFVIYGVLNYTTVTIQLNAAITYEGTQYTSGDILTLQVSRLEAVQITASGDLTGSIISSDYPIGVIDGHSCINNPTSGCDVLLEQSIPVSNWGRKHFYSATGVQTGSSKYRIVAFYNDTSFIVNSNNITLDSGEFRDFDLIGNGIIDSTKPASLKQILTQINGIGVDPSLIQVPAENQFVFTLGFTTPTKSGANANGFNNFVNIIVKTNERQSLRLNGNQINNTNTFSPPYIVHEYNILGSDNDLIVVRLPRVENVYFITQELSDSSPMSATVYGYEASESYGYIAGLSLRSNEQGVSTTSPFPTQTTLPSSPTQTIPPSIFKPTSAAILLTLSLSPGTNLLIIANILTFLTFAIFCIAIILTLCCGFRLLLKNYVFIKGSLSEKNVKDKVFVNWEMESKV